MPKRKRSPGTVAYDKPWDDKQRFNNATCVNRAASVGSLSVATRREDITTTRPNTPNKHNLETDHHSRPRKLSCATALAPLACSQNRNNSQHTPTNSTRNQRNNPPQADHNNNPPQTQNTPHKPTHTIEGNLRSRAAAKNRTPEPAKQTK